MQPQIPASDLQVPRPDDKPDDLGLLLLDEPCVKQSDPRVLSLWLSEETKQHHPTEVLPLQQYTYSTLVLIYLQQYSCSSTPGVLHLEQYTCSITPVVVHLQQYTCSSCSIMEKIIITIISVNIEITNIQTIFFQLKTCFKITP